MAYFRKVWKQEGMRLPMVSKNTGISVPAISNYESETVNPTMQGALQLEQVYDSRMNSENLAENQLIDDGNILIKQCPVRFEIRSPHR